VQEEQIYQGTPGQHISHAAADACEMASERAVKVMLEFNDVMVSVLPDSSPESVVADWQRGMDTAAEAYRASPTGRQAAQRRADQLDQAQAEHDAAMAALPARFADARSAIAWLMSFYDSADDIGIVRKDFGRVADVLEASGWRDSEACHLPKAEYEKPAVLGRWIIGQAIDMLRKGLPPHPVLMDKFGTKFLATVSQ
jgi:hypothetical protein